MKNNTIKRTNKTNAVNIITTKTKGRFFTVTFITKDGYIRTINGNYKKSKKLNLGYLNIYSAKDNGYRTVNTRTIKELKFKNITYKIK